MGELRELGIELWADRRRLLLVVVSLAWGTLGLTVLLGFGEGMDTAMTAALHRSGDRMLRLASGSTTRAFDGLGAGRRVLLTPDDADALRRHDGVARVSVEHEIYTRLAVDEFGFDARVHGVDDVYAAIRGFGLTPGSRFLSPIDLAERRRVAVLGAQLAARLFGGAEAVGRSVRIGSAPFLVIGVIEQRAVLMNYSGLDEEKAFVPSTTLRASYGLRYPSYVIVEAVDPADSRALIADLRSTLARRLRFDPTDRGAVWANDHAGQSRRIAAVVSGTRLFLAIVGFLGLLVAAIGVGNSVHAMVEERVREIGLRMALGATPAQIRARQLVEAGLLVAVGGGAGLVIAAMLLFGLAQLPLDPNARAYLGSPVPSVGVAATVAVLLGACALVAGWAPARRAATIQPVEALRHD